MPAAIRTRKATAKQRDDQDDVVDRQGDPAAHGAEGPAEAADILTVTDALLDEIDAVLEVPDPEQPTITLSDLMRAGAKNSPQAFSTFQTAEGATCAIASAVTAAKDAGLL